MAKKKSEKNYDNTASTTNEDTYTMLFDSMIKSRAFQELTPNGKVMLLYCRNQKTCKNGRACLYELAKERAKIHKDDTLINKYMTEPFFVFPSKQLEIYGIDRRNASRYFKELENKGFIKKIECNKGRYKVNLYKFIDAWKDLFK